MESELVESACVVGYGAGEERRGNEWTVTTLSRHELGKHQARRTARKVVPDLWVCLSWDWWRESRWRGRVTGGWIPSCPFFVAQAAPIAS